MRLKAVGLPDALHRAQAYADGFGDRSSGPMRGVSGGLGTRQRQHLCDCFCRQWRFAGLARLIAQQPVHPLFGVAPLPAPDRGAADAAQACDIENAAALGGMKNNLRPLHMLLQAIAISDDSGQARAVFGGEDDADGLSHAQRIACFAKFVNPKFASVH